MKKIIKTCKEHIKHGKIVSVEIEEQEELETVQEVINNYNNGERYIDVNGESVKPYNKNTEIRSHRNNKPHGGLDNLPHSNRCVYINPKFEISGISLVKEPDFGIKGKMI